MKKIFTSALLISFAFLLHAQDKPAYQIFEGNGDQVKYKQMMKELQKADFVFYGELHNNAIAHWLELEITRDLYEEKGHELVLGAEMFETDNQILIDELFSGLLTEKKFTEDCRLWKNYPTDYKPLLMFAKDKKIPFVATNIPRRYASLVASKGFEVLDSLSPEAKAFLPPLPIAFDPEVPCYKNMLSMMSEMDAPAAGTKPAPAMPGAMAAHSGQNTVKAQAIKDATMAHFILKNIDEGFVFLHINGSYHSDNYEGVVWYLKEYNKRNATDLKIVTISSVDQDDVDELEKANLGKADFIVCIPEDMTLTQPPSPEPVMPPAAMKSAPPKMEKADTTKKELPVENGGSDDDDDDD